MTGGRGGLPRPALFVVGAWAATGLVTLAFAGHRLSVTGWPGAMAIIFAVVFGVLMAASWIWPMKFYIDRSEPFDLDEGFFVLLILLVPAAMTVLVFAVGAIAVAALKRRPLVQSVFNVGQVVTSAGAGALVFTLIRGSDHSTR